MIISNKNEHLISGVAYSTAGIQLLTSASFIILWAVYGYPTLNIKEIELFNSKNYKFYIDFYFDPISAVYLIVGCIITFLVTIYSKTYMHREVGYKRFFNTILFFYLGYNLVILSGNLETLFIGWEILGISSFLLIAFYRERYLPVKNGVKVFSIYRLGDVGIILTMWASHHFWNENITFTQLSNDQLVYEHLLTHNFIGIFLSLMILISAAVKSAQLPFSFWLPRAMEGPTPSSAIFYGSLAVHLGVFLLLRTFPFWEHQIYIRILIGITGLITSIITTGIARVQSSIKSQIAYSSIAQIGIMFIEVAAGFETLALIHFAGNAFLRSYQLLVSPSVVTYLIREQFYNFNPRPLTFEDSLPKRIENTLYILSLKEWNLDNFMFRYLWKPFKMAGNKLKLINLSNTLIVLIPVYSIGLYLLFNQQIISKTPLTILPITFSIIGLLMILKSFSERRNVLLSWILVIMNHFWIALAIGFNEQFSFNQIELYLSGVTICGALGYFCLRRLKSLESNISLERFHGYCHKHPILSNLFLLACLGEAGFPISPTFIGEDVLFSHIHEDQVALAFLVSLSFILNGLAIIRIYSRVFLGTYTKSNNDIQYRAA
ncbi:MAG TPA: proton-conducting transporter membrane subunit [Cytophagaceae bacterium]